MLWLALSSIFASEHQLVLSVEFLPIQRYARGRWLEGKIHRKPGVRSPGKASVEEPKMSPCVRKQSQSLDLKMICEETCGRHNEGSLKCYTYLCTTFLLNFICPQGSVAQIHSKAHWFQKVEKCLLSQGNCFSSSGYSDKFSRPECDVSTRGISTGGRRQLDLGSVLAHSLIICVVSRKFFSPSQSLILLIYKIGIK